MRSGCDQQKRLLLVDGHAAAYRFFHGIRPMTSSAGTPVQAVYGFIRMMQQLQRTYYPTHQAVAFDGGVPAFRLALVPEYKAQRKPMPDDLRTQLPILQEYLRAADVPFFCFDAIEADDIIATFAKRFPGRVYVVTSDKDMFQLISENVTIVPLSGSAGELDTAGVQHKTGVLPSQIPDWLALIGDAADNIKGVPGVGPKTAAVLLQQFGSLDALFGSLHAVQREGLRRALEAHRDIVWRNRDMVLLHEVDALPGDDMLVNKALPVNALRLFYEKYSFKGFAQALQAPELF